MHTANVHQNPSTARACETLEQVRELQEAVPADAPYAPDWIVKRIVDKGTREQFRWFVVGLNANCEPGEYGRVFRWHVPRLDWRYDLSGAELVSTELEACRSKVE